MLNPAGTFTDSVVLPALKGWNSVVTLKDPPAIVTGEGLMVPTVVFELVTLTVADKPPRTCCTAVKFPDESSCAE